MRTTLAASLLCATLCAAWSAAGEPSFTAKPTAAKAGDGAKISFAVSAPTDVEVAVLAADGKVVRHLAAGLLGKSAPEPFKKDALAQEVVWDGKDDAGKPAAGGPFKARVSLGAKPKFERIAGWDGATLGSSVAGMVVGKGGELFVIDSDRGWGRAGIRVFDKDGKYLRTIVPYPANTPKERAAGVFGLEVDGERFPMVASGHCGSLVPLFAGVKTQTPAWHPKGHLVLFSAVGTIAEHGPPRYLLAMHPEGGAPEGVGFVGPQLRAPIGFMGGAGERDHNFYDHLAVSPDGEYVYLTTFKLYDKSQPHAVYRVKWSDKELGAPFLGKLGESGADDAHFNNPQGLAVDKAGNLYVCDRGNNRVMVFDKDGKLLGKFAVEHPYEVAVHNGTGEIYTVSRKCPADRNEKIPPVRVSKFSPWGKGEPKELARIEAGISAIALDPESTPARIWGESGRGIVQLLDKGAALEVGATITSSNGLAFPMFIAADPARDRVLVREKSGGLFTLDLKSNKISPLGLKGTDPALDRDGNIYIMDGYGTNSMSRYAPDGKPLPFAATGSHKLATGVYRGYGPDMGLRGHCVAPNGDIYLIRSCNVGAGAGGGAGAVVDVFGPDGKPKKTPLVNGLGTGDCGLGVDAAGNVYVGVNVKPKDKPVPEAFAGKVLIEPYVWWRKFKREPPWHYLYYNPYLYHWGSVMKFGPEGGVFYGNSMPVPDKNAAPTLTLAEAPADAVALKTGYLGRDLKVAGMKWRYAGYGPVPTSDTNWGDPSCICMTARLAADEYGRVFAPNPYRFSVEMLDTGGNQIARIGRYGNADSAGPGSKVPEPEIAFAWPAFVSVAGGKVYVGDPDSRRISVIRFEHAAEETFEVK
ncbi:MAG TPA: hypothetical protein PK280_14850 [Planctomycetota bacterium]|nr:hypothetical protein [Planctomycetota bacterium]